jgi:hypothetical protein
VAAFGILHIPARAIIWAYGSRELRG